MHLATCVRVALLRCCLIILLIVHGQRKFRGQQQTLQLLQSICRMRWSQLCLYCMSGLVNYISLPGLVNYCCNYAARSGKLLLQLLLPGLVNYCCQVWSTIADRSGQLLLPGLVNYCCQVWSTIAARSGQLLLTGLVNC